MPLQISCPEMYNDLPSAFSYGLQFPLHKVIVEILNKNKLAYTQVVPTSGIMFVPLLRHMSCVGYLIQVGLRIDSYHLEGPE